MHAGTVSRLYPGCCLAIAAGLALAGLAPLTANAEKSAQQAPQQSARNARVEDRAADLEERLIDLQVQIATMRSLAANEAPAATGAAPQQAFQGGRGSAAGDQRIAALENEVRTLSGEMQQLSGRPSMILPAATKAHAPAPAQSPAAQGAAPPAAPAPDAQGAATGWFGTTTVTPSTGSRGEILPGTVFPGSVPAPGNSVAGWAKPDRPAASVPANPAPAGGDPETEYQTAYGYLLQQDYGAAQAAFVEFVSRHPSTALAGNAQYWSGETHYVRGAYKDAAVAFLKGYEKYGDGNKGPDSLLKLALSLGKLRQDAAACSSLRELANRYRTAPPSLLTRGRDEMRRLRCPAN